MIIIEHPPGRSAERHYIYAVIFDEFLGIDYTMVERPGETVTVTSDDPVRPGEIVIPDEFFAIPEDRWLTVSTLPELPLRSYRVDAHLQGVLHHETLPALFGRRGNRGVGPAVFHREGDVITLVIDIPGSIFYLLTRYEEVVITARDEHQRFRFDESLLVKGELTERALANEYLELLWAMMTEVWPGLRRKERAYRLMPTHDIDVPLWSREAGTARLMRSMFTDVFIRHDTALAVKRFRSVGGRSNGSHQSDPNNTFDFMMDCSEDADVRSTFFLKAGRSSLPYDTAMLVDDGWMRSLVRTIHRRGHEIALHPSYESFDDAGMIRKEFSELRRVCGEEGIEQPMWGGRQHYLRWKNPVTWQNYDDAGIGYDSSLSFVRTVGFRTGCCYEYTCFNLQTRRKLTLRERPLIVMDSNAFPSWLQPTQHALEKVYQLSSTCRAFNGDFVILWHNSSLIGSRQQRAYTEVMRQCR